MQNFKRLESFYHSRLSLFYRTHQGIIGSIIPWYTRTTYVELSTICNSTLLGDHNSNFIHCACVHTKSIADHHNGNVTYSYICSIYPQKIWRRQTKRATLHTTAHASTENRCIIYQNQTITWLHDKHNYRLLIVN